MLIESMIDYVVFNTGSIPLFLYPEKTEDSFTKNYQKMYVCNDGTTIHFGNKKTDKFRVVMSGTQCRSLQNEFGTLGMCEMINQCNPSVTRLDLAITQFIDHDGLLTVENVQEWYIADMIDCRHVKHGSSWFESDRPNKDDEKITSGKTFYIGDWSRRAKHGIFRAYDKALELNLDEYMITRIEIEEKRKDAQVSFNRLLSGNSVNQVFKSRFDVSDEKFQAMLDCESIDITRGKSQSEINKESDAEEMFKRWGWLLHQVAPALGRALAYDLDNEQDPLKHYNEFIESVYDHANKARGV